METLNYLFGEGKDLNALQMSDRAIVLFFITLICIRIGGRRAFGQKSAFDNVIVIVLGSVIARGIAGASAFIPTVVASLMLSLLHRFLGWSMIRTKWLQTLVKGNNILLFKDGRTIEENLRKACMTNDDLIESLRLETNQTSMQKVDVAYMETNGRVSFILKEKE